MHKRHQRKCNKEDDEYEDDSGGDGPKSAWSNTQFFFFYFFINVITEIHMNDVPMTAAAAAAVAPSRRRHCIQFKEKHWQKWRSPQQKKIEMNNIALYSHLIKDAYRN